MNTCHSFVQQRKSHGITEKVKLLPDYMKLYMEPYYWIFSNESQRELQSWIVYLITWNYKWSHRNYKVELLPNYTKTSINGGLKNSTQTDLFRVVSRGVFRITSLMKRYELEKELNCYRVTSNHFIEYLKWKFSYIYVLIMLFFYPLTLRQNS